MPSEYDALLDEPATTEQSPYDALLTEPSTPQTGIEAATAYGQQQGAPTIEEQKTLLEDVPESVRKPLEAAAETIAGFVPKTALQVAELATPVVGAVQTVADIPRKLSDIFNGKPLTEIFPPDTRFSEAEKTPPFSKERYRAGFQTIGELGMAATIGRGLAPKAAPTLTETLGFGEKTPEVVTAANESLAQLESQQAAPAPPVPEAPAPTTAEPLPEAIQKKGMTVDEARTVYEQAVAESKMTDAEMATHRGMSEAYQEAYPYAAEYSIKHAKEVAAIPFEEHLNKLRKSNKLIEPTEGVPSASEITSPESVPVSTQGEEVGTGASLRQQGTAPETRKGIEAGQETATNEVAPPPTGPPATPTAPTAPEPVPDTVTGIANKVTGVERARRGLPEAAKPEERSWQQAMDEAQARDSEGANLVETLKNNPRALSDTEDALLLREQIKAQQSHDAAVKRVNENPGDTAAQAELEAARNRVQSIYDVDKTVGTEAARGFNARKILADQDFTLAKMEATVRAEANGGKPLTEKQASRISQIHSDIEKTEEAYQARVKKVEKLPSAKGGDKAINQLRKRINSINERLERQVAQRKGLEERQQKVKGKETPFDLETETLLTELHKVEAMEREGKVAVYERQRLASRKESLERQIAQRKGLEPRPQPREKLESDVEVEGLETELQRLRAIDKEAQQAKKGTPEERKMLAREKRLEEAVARRKGLLPSKGKSQPLPDNIESEILKTELSLLKEIEKEGNRLPKARERIQKGIEEYQKRTGAKDISPLRPPRQAITDPETVRLLHKRDTARTSYHDMLASERFKSQPLYKQAAHYIAETAVGVPRSIKSAFDLSGLLRQGGLIVSGRPIVGAKSVAPMLKAFASEESQFAAHQEIVNHPLYERMRRAKLEITEAGGRMSAKEEAFKSQLAEKIPGVAASERAYTTVLNKIRADTFESMTGLLEQWTGRKLRPGEDRLISNYINVASGRGNMGRFASAANALAKVFWSPRLAVSRIQWLMGQPLWNNLGQGSFAARALIATEYARTVAGIGLMASLAKMAGANVELDPRSGNFGIQFGNTRVDLTAGLKSYINYFSRILTGRIKTQKGTMAALGEHYGSPTFMSLTANMARQKLAPAYGSASNIMMGEQPGGQPTTAMNEALGFYAPLSPQDVSAALQTEGVPEQLGLSLLAIGGMSIQNYESMNKSQRDAVRNRLEQRDKALLRGDVEGAYRLTFPNGQDAGMTGSVTTTRRRGSGR